MQLQTKDQLMMDNAGIKKSPTTVQLQTKDQLMIDNAGIKKSHTTLGEIVGLHNCAVANITPQLRLSAKRKDDHL